MPQTTVSIQSRSPGTPIASLFQEPIDNDSEQQQADDEAKADRERIGKGKWDKGKEEVMTENMGLKKRLLEYQTAQDRDEIWESERLWSFMPVTQMSPNGSPSKGVKYIADNIEKWVRTALETGQYPQRQVVNGAMVDVASMVKVEIERMKNKPSVGQSSNWTGGNVAGTQGGFGGASPSTDATVESPGQWIGNLVASGSGDDGGGGSEGDPTDGNGVVYRGGRRDDRSKEFTFVNPRNVNIPTFIGKALNTNPYLFFNNAIRRFIMAQGADGDTLVIILNHVEKMGPNTFINDMLQELIAIEFPKAL